MPNIQERVAERRKEIARENEISNESIRSDKIRDKKLRSDQEFASMRTKARKLVPDILDYIEKSNRSSLLKFISKIFGGTENSAIIEYLGKMYSVKIRLLILTIFISALLLLKNYNFFGLMLSAWPLWWAFNKVKVAVLAIRLEISEYRALDRQNLPPG